MWIASCLSMSQSTAPAPLLLSSRWHISLYCPMGLIFLWNPCMYVHNKFWTFSVNLSHVNLIFSPARTKKVGGKVIFLTPNTTFKNCGKALPPLVSRSAKSTRQLGLQIEVPARGTSTILPLQLHTNEYKDITWFDVWTLWNWQEIKALKIT